MIFYFSSTGNSQYVAQRIAEATSDTVLSMTQCLRDGQLHYRLAPGERLGFVTPVYFWGLPTVVCEFMERVEFDVTDRPFAYHVLTFGTTTGQAHHQMRRLLKHKGIRLLAAYCVKTVDSWTPLFDVSDAERIERTLQKAERQTGYVIQQVQQRVTGNFDRYRFPAPLARLYYLTYKRQRRTAHLHVLTDRCVGCGLCAKQCPTDSIALNDGLPTWTKAHCAMCLSCLHHCPKFAIQYGRHTLHRGQYVHPNL